MSEEDLRKGMGVLGRTLSERGYSPGSSGNISVRLDDGFLMSPTGTRLGMLDPERISRLDREGHHIGGDRPSKEVVVHLALYRSRPRAGAVVHLHSPHSMAVSCLRDLDESSALPPLTPYCVMRLGRVPLVPYFRPGDPALAEAVERKAAESHALLLAHHGLIVAGSDLDDAVGNAEEFEETARLFLLLKDRPYRPLSESQIAELREAYPIKI
jgi:ribulose-5-phosphate 4-epimerase/fuculose-1-phosphate aldolase